jgi:VWFA-related protein
MNSKLVSRGGVAGPGLRVRERVCGHWFGFVLGLLLIPTLAAAPVPQNQNPAPAPAPAPSPAKPNLTSVVQVVNVLATVHDKKGDIVKNLTKDDFALSEDDHPQDIKYFLLENDLPVTVGLLVDTSLSQRRVLSSERTASYDFLNQLLRQDKDRACVIHFDREVEMLQDLTSSHQKLEDALKLLETPDDSGGNNGGSGGRGGYGHGGGTLLYDAVYLASNDVMTKEQGHKALIVLSDGVDHGSKESLEDAIEAAQHANVLVYSILFADHDEQDHGFGGGYGGHGGYGGGGPWGGGGPGGGPMGGGGGRRRYPQEERPDGKKILTQISKETGARMFEVSKKLPIDKIYAQIEDELRNQYSLGFTPGGMDAALGYHKVTLTTKKTDLIVQARDGFYVDR